MPCELRLLPSADAPWCIFFVYYKHLFNWVDVWGKQIFSNVYAPKKIIKMFAEYEGKGVCVTSLGQKWANGHMTVNSWTKWKILQAEEMALQRNHPLIWTLIIFNILLVQSLFIWSSAVNHLVQGSEWRQDATFVGLHHLSVLDHLVQDDVDSIQVEHDLLAGLSRMQMRTQEVQHWFHSYNGRIRPVRSVDRRSGVKWEAQSGHVTVVRSVNSPHGWSIDLEPPRSYGPARRRRVRSVENTLKTSQGHQQFESSCNGLTGQFWNRPLGKLGKFLISHLAVSDANHDVESSILTKNQLEIFIFHKGTLEAELVLKNIFCSLLFQSGQILKQSASQHHWKLKT